MVGASFLSQSLPEEWVASQRLPFPDRHDNVMSHQSDISDPQGLEREVGRMNCDSIREFIIDSLRAMNYDVEGIDDDTELGPRGADLESLALAELAIRVEDRFAVKWDEADELALMTVGEFCEIVAGRISPTAL
jgi:acyl carrier protein